MSSLLIDLIICFWLLLFGALAFFPLMLDGKQAHRPSASNAEDRVISIRPMLADDARRPQPIAQPGPTAIALDQREDQDHPRHAA